MLEIKNIPRNFTRNKIEKLLSSKISADFWSLERLIPLDNDYYIAWILCKTADIEKQFLQAQFKIKDIALQITNDDTPTSNIKTLCPTKMSILNLNDDCLIAIFENLPLKTQIHLAKTCRYFYDLIYQIWKNNYKIYIYRLTNQLTEEELKDFNAIIGPFVKHLVFDGILTLDSLKIGHTLSFRADKSLIESLKIYININLCRHLMNFVNLEIFEVLGTTLMEFTIQEIARYCKKITTIRLLDCGDTKNAKCSHFHKFKCLEELIIENCSEFQQKSFLKICKRNKKLHTLNINGCQQLNSAKFLIRVCRFLQNLTNLNLNAVENEKALSHIFENLEKLQIIKFQWIQKSNSSDATKIEQLLFKLLAFYKANELLSIKFEIDPLRLAYTTQNKISDFEIESKRENTVLRSFAWNLGDYFTTVVVNFEQLTILENIIFIYCRLFSNEDILKLSKICTNLKNLTLHGHRTKEDNNLLSDWRKLQMNGELSKDCHLRIDGLLSPKDNDELREKLNALPYRTANLMPTIRSIECKFKPKTTIPIG